MVYSFFLRYDFIPLGFLSKIFNETSYTVLIVLLCDGCQPYFTVLIVLLCDDVSDDASMHNDCIVPQIFFINKPFLIHFNVHFRNQ